MLIHSSYSSIRHEVRPGDILAFAGTGLTSRIISRFSGGPVTHTGMVLTTPGEDNQALYIDSTQENGRKGVLVQPLDDVLVNCQRDCWWLPLSEETRARLQLGKMYDFLLAANGGHYDMRGVLRFGWRKVPLLGRLFGRESLSCYFCSELCAAALEYAGAVGNVNASKTSPHGLVEWAIYESDYTQLVGTPRELPRVNSRPPQ